MHLNYSPQVVFVIGIVIAVVSLFVRLVMLKSMINFNAILYIKKVILNVIPVGMASVLAPLLLCYFVEVSFIRLMFTVILSIISVATAVCLIGLSTEERVFFKTKINVLFNRIFKKLK